MKINKRDPLHWLILLRQGLYTLIAACGRYLSGKPAKPVVILYGHQLSGNLKALYEEWERSHTQEFDCHFLSLDPTYGPQLRAEGINVLLCSSLRDMLLAGRCSAMITDHGLHAMSPFITLTDVVFIDVWHGIPYKGFIPDDFRVQHRYDEVWVSSPLLKTVYEKQYGFPPEIVHALGYARADKLFLKSPPANSLRKQLSIPADSPIVLYAPTWQQDDAGRELFPFGESQASFLEALAGTCRDHNATLVVRSHLNALISQKSSENIFYCSMKDFPCSEDLLLETDILICDWSSISFDYLALCRPTIFLDVEPPFKNGFSLGKEYRFGAVVSNIDRLKGELDAALSNPDTYMTAHRDKYSEVIKAVYAEHIDGGVSGRQWQRLSQH